MTFHALGKVRRLFWTSPLDALVIGPFLVLKEGAVA
jgi:hypothetical protein